MTEDELLKAMMPTSDEARGAMRRDFARTYYTLLKMSEDKTIRDLDLKPPAGLTVTFSDRERHERND